MSLTYIDYVEAMQTLLVIPENNSDQFFQLMIPRMIEYAELRIYRELDFLSTSTAVTALTAAANRSISVPTNLIVLESVNFITPASTLPDAGTRNPVYRVSLEFLNSAWPVATQTSGTPSIPRYYALLNADTALMAPAPDGIYNVEFIGTVRPAPLTATNSTTFLTTYLPDLFIAASAVWGFGYQRDFGAQSNDPQAAMSWEQTYQSLRAGANVEELRKKFEAPGWSSYSSSPSANMSRGGAATMMQDR